MTYNGNYYNNNKTTKMYIPSPPSYPTPIAPFKQCPQ